MRNQTLAILTVISVCWVALWGCAPSDSDSGSSGGEKVLTGLIADLQGAWVTEWYWSGGNYSKHTFVVSGTNITWQRSYNLDFQSPYSTDYKRKTTGNNLNIGEMTIFDDGTVGYKFTYRFQTASATSLEDGYSDCGIENWQKNVSVDLVGKICFHTKVKKDTEIPNVLKLVDGRLYLGFTELDAGEWEYEFRDAEDIFGYLVEPSLTVYPSTVIVGFQDDLPFDVPFTKQ